MPAKAHGALCRNGRLIDKSAQFVQPRRRPGAEASPVRTASSLQIRLEPVEDADGVAGILTDPAVVDLLDRQRVEMVPALAPLALCDDQIGLFEYLEMHHHRAPVHVRESLAERAGGLRQILQPVEQLAPARMRQ